VADPIAERRGQRAELIATAAAYVEALGKRIGLVAAAVAGSVARGDFNLWSDIDVVVVANGLPPRAPERAGLLLKSAPARVQPVGYSPAEFALAVRRGDRLACEVLEVGVSLAGDAFFAEVDRPDAVRSTPS
jgi:predicted nucleotidyltransferase